MKNHKDDTPDYQLLARYLAGESTPEEAIEVDDWILSSEKNRKLFDQVSVAWQEVAKDDAKDEPLQKKRPAPIYKLNVYRIGIAASLVVLISAGWLLFRSPRKKAADTPSPSVAYITKRAGQEILRDTLPDRSVVIQNVNSILRYASDFNTNNRTLQMSGEAWFDVTANAAKPFGVGIGKIRVIVLGTSFNVQQDTARIVVTVNTGSVMMHSDSDSLVVKAGQKGVYDIIENKFTLFNSFNINDQGYATHKLVFENAPLKEIAAQVEKAYGITVIFRDEKFKNLTMSSTFDNDSITSIFDVVSLTLHVNYTIVNKVVYISGT
jgi:transmembrane sensor